MRVGIIGAGLAGLAAARRLKTAGQDAVLFEKEPYVGGRLRTVSQDGFVFDAGATSFAPGGRALQAVLLQELPRESLFKIEQPIYVHEGLRVRPGDPTKSIIPRYTYTQGNQHLAELLVKDLDVRLSHPVEIIEPVDSRYRVHGETFDAVIVTLPVPSAMPLIASLGARPALAYCRYRPCLSICLGYDRALPEVRYHAIVDPEQRHPLTWLSLESVKCPARAPEGQSALVAQLSPSFSASHMGFEDDRIVALTTDYLERLYGKSFSTPKVAKVVRWFYSQPEAVVSFDTVNHPGMRVLVASDGLIGSRTEHAYEAGLRAAELLIERK